MHAPVRPEGDACKKKGLCRLPPEMASGPAAFARSFKLLGGGGGGGGFGGGSSFFALPFLLRWTEERAIPWSLFLATSLLSAAYVRT